MNLLKNYQENEKIFKNNSYVVAITLYFNL